MRLRKGEKVVLVEEYSHFPFFPKGTTATVDMDEDNGHLVWIRSPLSPYATEPYQGSVLLRRDMLRRLPKARR